MVSALATSTHDGASLLLRRCETETHGTDGAITRDCSAVVVGRLVCWASQDAVAARWLWLAGRRARTGRQSGDRVPGRILNDTLEASRQVHT